MITVPIEVSHRHIHLSQAEVNQLFGPGHRLRPHRPLSQTSQFAAHEVVTVRGPKGTLDGVRLVGPPRSAAQVELSRTDARVLGIDAPLRDSGRLEGTPGVTLVGPAGSVSLPQGVIVQQRHIHASPEDGQRYGLANGDVRRVKVGGERGLVFDNVLVRIQPAFVWRLHLDTDEANAAGVRGGETAEIIP